VEVEDQDQQIQFQDHQYLIQVVEVEELFLQQEHFNLEEQVEEDVEVGQ
jgi:hypothetical protein